MGKSTDKFLKNTMHKDCIVSYIDGYGPDQIKNLVNSVHMCGFKGPFYMFLGDKIGPDTVRFLDENKVTAIYPSIEKHWLARLAPVVRRFYAYWEFFQSAKDICNGWVICVDAKDVIFQYNPINWLNLHATAEQIVVGGENVSYEAEPWGNDNFRTSFPLPPLLWETMRSKEIFNAGSFACRESYFSDFCKQIFMMSLSGRTHNPDQAALNILVNDAMYNLNVKKAWHSDLWALQCGTTHDPNKTILQMTDELPGAEVYNGVVYHDKDKREPYCIVHQYDRVPHLKVMIDERYGSTKTNA